MRSRPSRSPSRSRRRPGSRSPPRSRPQAQNLVPSGGNQLVCFPGGGTFFWWQLGAATALLELYDLSGVFLSGISAGALAATLSLCKVDPLEAHRVAFTLADDAGVFRNPLGLAFKWGRLVESWLRTLLPEDAGRRCDGAAAIVMTAFAPWPRAECVTRFDSREQLIACLMASTHIPFFMDGRFGRRLEGGALLEADERDDEQPHEAPVRASRRAKPVLVADGGILEFFGVRSQHSLLTHGTPRDASTLVLDPMRDDVFMAACAEHGWSMLKPEGADQFIAYGRAFVERHAALGAAGQLKPLEGRLRSEARGRVAQWRRDASVRTKVGGGGGQVCGAHTAVTSVASLPSSRLYFMSSLLRVADGVSMRGYALRAVVLTLTALAPLLAVLALYTPRLSA